MTTHVNQVIADPEAEQVVLGSMLQAPGVITDALAVLAPEDFHEPKHQTICEAIKYLQNEGAPTSHQAVLAHLRNLGEDAKIGGAAYLTRLLSQSMPAAVPHFSRIVKDQAVRRKALDSLNRSQQMILNPSGMDVSELISATMRDFEEVTAERASSDILPISETFQPTLDHIEDLGRGDLESTGVPSGFIDLDRMTQGLHGGQMIIIAARPAVGKSTLGLDLVRACAIKHRMPALIFSLEMSAEEITTRMISAECRINLSKLRSGDLDDQDWARITQRMPDIVEAPLYIDDTATITMSEIKAKARRVKAKYGLRLVVIDYLQLMTGDRRVDSRQQEVSEISRNIKLLAKELGVPVVAMSQLNRGSEQRADKKPQVADLRESGSIEQDADVIILLYREELADPETDRVGECDLIVAKQRNGPTGIVTVGAHLHHSRFVDMAQDRD